MSTSAALPEEPVPALSEGQRLLYTFTAPSKTMADLRRNASWWVPWLLVSIVSIAFCYTLDKKIAGRSLQRKLDPDAPLFIDFDEHVRAYEGSDRQPVYIRH